ncbi:AzlD domain-containing protein [Otariodibacter oris]|uniref:Branched-subunit amino acid transport protein AzlD n=1 Tax=Otariodibacter oris TaxID=1032623 RepID=A0A420XFA2_9PAST|nr:AzlD domain-containing protein [Otariodibacter oris]QGM81603.1 branched-chain amino acid transport [Otariodibacter oris]RKR71215.1 branched-subunit amino acid transport protein AzlD [Otariodibacter oris]
METIDIIYMLIALVLGAQICRLIPLVLPKTIISHPILQKLNRILPLIIMILLVLTSLALPKEGTGYTLLIAQVLALITVILSYHWFKNILISVSLGVLNVNLLIWLLG